MGSKVIKPLISTILSATLLATCFLPVQATELDDKLNQLDKINNSMEKTQDRLQQNEQAKKSVFEQLQKINGDISSTEKEVENIDLQLSAAQTNLSQTEKELQATQERLQTQLVSLDARMKDIYINGDVSLFEVLLNATDISDFITRFTLMEKMAEEDSRMISEIETEQKAIEAKKADLELKRNEIASMKSAQEQKKNTLTSQSQEKSRLMVQIQNEKGQLEKMLDDLEAQSNRLESVVQQLQKSSGQQAVIPGAMTYPTPGYTKMTSPFGMRFHPILKVNKLHTGVDFGAPMGAKMVAAKAGTVILASAQTGYGNTVVIDHGGGITTLYGHMSAFSVKVGDKVTKGQQIGKVGSTGWSTGPHAHFEVRKNGAPVNPVPYLNGK